MYCNRGQSLKLSWKKAFQILMFEREVKERHKLSVQPLIVPKKAENVEFTML